MNGKIRIRREEEKDFRRVEEITRESFWNLYVPGCDEHYLVHVMRSHEDFVPELGLMIELDGQVIGNIMYTKSTLTDASGTVKDILTFGPVSVLPEYQRRGCGKALMERSFEIAAGLGYDVIVIYGNPGNYVSRGFKSCRKFNISLENGDCPTAMMAKELAPGALDGRNWIYRDSPALQTDPAEAARFDETFPKKTKGFQPSQEEFYIYSHSVLR
jgi:predicted N-acetyltransferase YhbS